jgi:hypothetical protein
MAGELSAAQKTEAFSRLEKTIKDEVQNKHKEYQSPSDVKWSNLGSHLLGQLKPLWLGMKRDPSHAGVNAARLAGGNAASLANLAVPFLGTVIKKVVDAGIGFLERHRLADEAHDREKPADLYEQAEWLGEYGVKDIGKSLLKFDAALKDFNDRAGKGITNCDDFVGLLTSYHYARHRCERLRSRVNFLRDFAESLSKELTPKFNELLSRDLQVRTKGLEVYDSWEWHAHNCFSGSKECVYPWDQQHLALMKQQPPSAGSPKVGALHPLPAAPQLVRRPPPPAAPQLPQGPLVRRPPPPRV